MRPIIDSDKAIAKADQLAIENHLSRKVISYTPSDVTTTHEVKIWVSGKSREEENYYFLAMEAHTKSQAIAIARAMAILEFLGERAPTTTVVPQKVTEAVKEVPQEVVETSPDQLEMETVPSPFKAAPQEEAPKIVEKAPKKPKAEKATKAPKEPKVVTTPYNPELQAHKIMLATFLNKSADKVGDWAKNPRTGELSKVILKGSAFLNDNGEILPTFQETVLNYYSTEANAL